MNKKIISFLSTIMLLISILPFIPIKVNAEECIYEIKISYPDRDVGLSCYQNYNDALTAMNEYPSTEMAVATIVKNGTIINAKYALAKIDVENNNIIYNTGEGFKRIYSTSQAAYYQGTSTLSSTYLTYIASTWGSEAAFLDYEPTYDTIKIKISGVTGYIKKNQSILVPISKFYTANHHYPNNYPTIKTTKSGIRLRQGPSLDYEQIENYASGENNTYRYYPSYTTKDDQYTWYKVKFNDSVEGWFASANNESWIIDISKLLNDTYYFTNNDILYHHIHKGEYFSDVNMTLGTAPFEYKEEKVKTYILTNSTGFSLDANNRYYSFDGNYFYTTFKEMIDDYRNGNYNNSLNKDNPHYPYFMYVPSRAKTNYQANTFNQMIINQGYSSFPVNPKSYVDPTTQSFVKNLGSTSMMYGIGEYLIAAQNKYGSNALSIFSAAARESGYGRSVIAYYKNNLFGMGAVDGNAFNAAYSYDSVNDSIIDYSKKISVSSYSNINDYRYNGTHLGNKLSGSQVQYASDPYSGESSTGSAYSLDLSNGQLDNYSNTLGIKNNNQLVNVYSEPSKTSRVLYQTKNNANGRILTNLSFIVSDKVTVYEDGKYQSYYKVFTDLTLNDNRVVDTTAYYNFENCYGYIKEEDLYVRNHQPEITAENFEIEQFETFKIKATAKDYENGDLTDKITYEGDINTDIPGDYKITYTVSDEERFSTSKTVTVTVKPTDAPIFSLEDVSIPQYVEYDPMTGVTAKSRLEGDLTDKIEIIDGELNVNEMGEYKITYRVTNDLNLTTEASRIITVIANEKPIITANNIYGVLNEEIDPLKYVKATDKEDGDLTKKVTYKGNFDITKVDTYEITYSVTDNANQTTEKKVSLIIEEKKYIAKQSIFHLENLDYNKDTKKLDFTGFLIIKGMHNLVETDIKYNIIFENQFNGTEIIMPLERLTKNMPFNAPSDGGYTNTGSWFRDALDLSNLPSGDYTVYLRARSGDFEAKTLLKNIFFKDIVRKFEIDGKGFLFKSNFYSNSVPLELFVREDGLLGNKDNPTIDNMFNQVFDIKLDGSKLKIKGTSHNVNGNYSAKTDVLRELYLENIETMQIAKKYDIGSITNGPYVVDLKVSDKLDKTRAWYETELDLNKLDYGTYSIQLRTKTGDIDDYGELYDILFKEIDSNSEDDNKKYSLRRNDEKRYRIEIKVEKKD